MRQQRGQHLHLLMTLLLHALMLIHRVAPAELTWRLWQRQRRWGVLDALALPLAALQDEQTQKQQQQGVAQHPPSLMIPLLSQTVTAAATRERAAHSHHHQSRRCECVHDQVRCCSPQPARERVAAAAAAAVAVASAAA